MSNKSAGIMTSFSLASLSIVENRRSAGVLFAFLLWSLSAVSEAGSSLDDVSAELENRWIALGGDAEASEFEYPSVSPGYQLPECTTALEVNVVRHLQPGRNGVEVSCAAPFWRQSFAVELKVFANVVTADADIRRDTVINAGQLRISRLDTSDLHKGYFSNIDAVSGMISKRTLRQGRGQLLKIRLVRPGIQVEMKGEALARGHLGEHIRVRNTQSGATLFAEVIGDGLVQVQ
jgi:flagella basal body P-ring formation protein FlgA